MRPGGELRVVQRHERVGDDRGLGHAGIEQPEVPGMGDMHSVPPQKSGHLRRQLGQRHRRREVEP
jgi:hypothetical protein